MQNYKNSIPTRHLVARGPRNRFSYNMNFSPFNGKKSFATFDNVKFQAPIDRMSKSMYIKNGIIAPDSARNHTIVRQNRPFSK